MFSSTSDLQSCLELVASEKNGVCVSQWLHSITDSLRVLVERHTSDTSVDLKAVFLQLSRAVLVYARLEAILKQRDFKESSYFLETCVAMGIFNKERDEQYHLCFEVIQQFLNGLASSETIPKTFDAVAAKLK